MVGVAELPAKYRPTGWVPSVEPEVPSMSALKSELGDPMPGESADGSVDRISDALGDEQALQLLTANTHGTEVVEELTCLPIDGLDLRSHLYTIERALIRQALERSSGTVAQAARLLNLRRTTLVEKLRKFACWRTTQSTLDKTRKRLKFDALAACAMGRRQRNEYRDEPRSP